MSTVDGSWLLAFFVLIVSVALVVASVTKTIGHLRSSEKKTRLLKDPISRLGAENMPQLPFSTALAIGALGVNPLAGWQYEYLPWPANVILLIRGTAGGINMTVYSGSETIQERAPIQAGGTAGVTPSELNTTPVVWQAAAGDRLKLLLDNTSGAAQTADGLIIANPLI